MSLRSIPGIVLVKKNGEILESEFIKAFKNFSLIVQNIIDQQ
jgi:hypothetical protein